MAASTSSPEVLPWLKSLPVAPEYHPTLAEFKDPIAYILKIEPEASRYGICKIVPPLPAAPKPTAIANLNHSFSVRSPSGDPTFTTCQQQIGFCARRPRPVQKTVWQSGNRYTLSQFEAKARGFERAYLRKSCSKMSSSSLSPLEVESLFWKAAADKPFSVEYANDMPGSGFDPLRNEEAAAAAAQNVGETAWNMRGVARAKGSLLRFMKEEIPGVTSPMVYVAMMYSWFAWHVEDHNLHSMNYLHMGAGKAWYGVPKDAALAFEEVVRVHGYGGEVNPLITFATLAEKTTVMSPEVLIGLGIPCCRLVQNSGEFVVTFPGSYHSGFSHGFNCGEASNIATPKWLTVAKEAAIRRASTNCPPMVSHHQLLYALVLSLSLRSPNAVPTPKSSRLKDKLRSAGEIMIKETFVQNVVAVNKLLTVLHDYSSCVILPQSTSDNLLFSDLQLNSRIIVKPRITLGLRTEDAKEKNSSSGLSVGARGMWTRSSSVFSPKGGNSLSVYRRRKLSTSKFSNFGPSEFHNSTYEVKNIEEKQDDKLQTGGYLDQGLLSCVTCGILSYACVAIIRPSEAAIRYIMSSDCNSFDVQVVRYNANCRLDDGSSREIIEYDLDSNFGNREMIHSPVQLSVFNDCSLSDAKVDRGASALDLLASAYGDLSDSEEDPLHHLYVETVGNNSGDSSTANCQNIEYGIHRSLFKGNKLLAETSNYVNNCSKLTRNDSQEFLCEGKTGYHSDNQHENIDEVMQSCLRDRERATNSLVKHADRVMLKPCDIKIRKLGSDSTGICVGSSSDSARTGNIISTTFSNMDDARKNSCMATEHALDKDFVRMHVFCLEHAVEVEKRLRLMGGAHIMLLCHPEYPKIESEAKLITEELVLNHQWKEVHYREASKEDQEKIRLAIEDEQAIPCNSDWTVKLGINLYYSVNLSQSPLYRKQLPYNAVIYKSFAQKLRSNQKISGRVAQRSKKVIVAGKWCGEVWMSNKVHPFLANQSLSDDEQELDQSSDYYSDRENETRSVVCRKSSSNNKAKGRRKSNKKRKRSSKPMSKGTNVEPPSMRLRKQRKKSEETSTEKSRKKTKKALGTMPEKDIEYTCDIEGCNMSFGTKHDLATHKHNVCPEKGCGKKFFSHKYLLQHRKVHVDDRPLKCPWKGCKVTFKWAWARTEHIRVHTGERPYVCQESGCGLTFRFVSDYSRHKRKTGHYSAKKSRG